MSDPSGQPENPAVSSSPSGFINQITCVFREQAESFVPSEVRQKLHIPFSKRLWVILGYLAVGTLIGWQAGFGLIGWWIGGLFGFFILDVDHLLDVFFLHPDALSSQQVKQAFKSRNWVRVWQVLIATAPMRKNLVLHTIIFEALIAVLAIYVVTSSGGLFPKALILAFWLRILFEQIREYMRTEKMDSWFWQIKDSVPSNLQVVFLSTGLVVWIIISIAALR
jgi:hypothetical protein